MIKLTLKACRVNVNATAKELAEYVGVSEDSIYKWENFKCSPSGKHVAKALEFFALKGCPVQIDQIKFLP